MFENEAWGDIVRHGLCPLFSCISLLLCPYITLYYHIHDTVQCFYYLFKFHGYVSAPSLVLKIMTF